MKMLDIQARRNPLPATFANRAKVRNPFFADDVWAPAEYWATCAG